MSQPPRRSQLAQLPFSKRIMVRLLIFLTPDCSRITQLASLSLDRRLTWIERQKMEWHFKMCSLCRRYLNQLQQLHRCACESREFVPREPPVTLSAEDKSKLKAVLRRRGEPT